MAGSEKSDDLPCMEMEDADGADHEHQHHFACHLRLLFEIGIFSQFSTVYLPTKVGLRYKMNAIFVISTPNYSLGQNLRGFYEIPYLGFWVRESGTVPCLRIAHIHCAKPATAIALTGASGHFKAGVVAAAILVSLQVFDCGELTKSGDDQFSDDDADQQSTSNFSDAGTQEVVDDSSCALQAHEQDCFSIAVAAERWLASGGEDDVAYLWDHQVSDSDPVLKIDHQDSVTTVAFNNAQTLLSTGDMSGHIVVTQLCDLSVRAKIDDSNDLEWMCWHSTSDILFAGDKDGMVWMWLIGPTGVAQSKVFAGNGSSCTAGHLLPDGKRLLAGYRDGAVRLWSLRDGTCTNLTLSSSVSVIHHHVSQPVGVIGTEDGSVHVVNTAHIDRLTITVVFPPLSEPSETSEVDEENIESCVECVQYSPFNSWLAVGRNDGTLCIYETGSTTPRSIYRAPSPQVVQVIHALNQN
ncbi:hypothetical protein Y032_0005g2661 [Ancylostoma ceylanicum]|uniref:Uncharacterized protein n=1 Tax=Ancylostoma ceylanicum TaxID=53326 RepID=A0A016VUM8_9BILA|nr:hypothetical protein Y032_0005g2661 [Ancylostoma ceylanicum]